jgi:hypothetical protein
MKNKVMLLSLIATTFMVSCKPNEEKPTEVIVIEQPVPAEEQPVPVENNDGTSIAVDENGVQINSDKTSIDIKEDKAKIEIK